jgi:hypothetical protein
MSGETEWTLQKIRQAYGEILEHYNILFAPQPSREKEGKEIPDAFETDGDDFYRKTFPGKFKEVFPKIKAAADHSGNAKTWRAGEPLDGLNEGLKERIRRGLEFGI